MTEDYDGDMIPVLRQEIARLSGELEAAKQTAREILQERNGWARELADMRDERDTARESLDNFRTLAAERENSDLARQVELEGAMREMIEEYDRSFVDWCPVGIDKMREVLDDD